MIHADRIRERLKATKLTANAASEAAGLGRTYIRDILRGRIKEPSAWRLMQLAEALQTSPAYLLGSDSDDWAINRPPADDRTPERIEEIGVSIERARTDRSPSNKLMFDLLDTVEDRFLIQMVWTFISENVYIVLEKSHAISKSELGIMCGQRDDSSTENFIRRLILAKILGVIDERTYFETIAVDRLNILAVNKAGDFDFDDAEVVYAAGPILQSHGVTGRSKELARLGIMGVFARYVNLDGRLKGHSQPNPT